MSRNKRGICSIPGCSREDYLTKTWCTRHYARYLRTGDLGPADRTLRSASNSSPQELVEYHGYIVHGECWEANGNRNDDGYVMWQRKKQKSGAHRVSYEAHHGKIPTGLEVMHSCDNRACINPAHLSAGTHGDNMRDCARKGRAPGRKLSEDQAKDIKVRLSRGERKAEIAHIHGVSESSVYLISVGKNWGWLTV